MSILRRLELAVATLAVALVTLAACGRGHGQQTQNGDVAPTGITKPADFDSVNAIFVDHCGSCHTTRTLPYFVGQPDVVKANAKELVSALTPTDTAVAPMPKIVQTTPLTDAQKQTIVAYANALEKPVAGAPTYADIEPILVQSCAGCHGDKGHKRPKFVGHKKIFDLHIKAIVADVTATDQTKVMPPIPATPLSADEQKTVLSYLNTLQ